MDDFERELKLSFLEEATQLLDDAEQCFLQLENASNNPEIVEKLFRLAHNLKGSGRAVGFSQIAEFTHVLESLLLKIKNHEIDIQTSTVTLLLHCNDHLKNWISTLKSDLDAQMDSHSLLDEMNAQILGIASSEKTSAAAEIAEESTPPVDPAEQSLTEESATQISEIQPTQTIFEFEKQMDEVKIELTPPQLSKTTSSENNNPQIQVQVPANAEDESIRVSLKRLENLINNVGELVILQTVLNQHRTTIDSPLVQRTIVQLAKITKEIQDTSMGLRMVPLKQTFQKMQRIVRDTSKSLGKEVSFTVSGEHTELDKTVVDHLGDPLVHLIRNAVDHGIESTEERLSKGKSPIGQIKLSAFHKGGKIVIQIQDDGRGLDAEKLRLKAIEKKILPPDAVISEKEAYELIFAPGFSTKSEVTEVSGRGVGMDVVKTNVEKKINGEIELETKLGEGTCISILLPLTLAIIDGMVVKTGEEKYIVPLAQVFESLQPKENDVHFVTSMGEILNLRGEQLPLLRLNQVLQRKNIETRPVCHSIAIVVRSGEKPFSILVDDILGQQQIVIKQLGTEIRHLRGITGSAILGDGRAALILDLNELALRNQSPSAETKRTHA